MGRRHGAGLGRGPGARRLIAGDVHPAGVCGSAHLVNREFKGFEVACDGNPLEKREMLDASEPKLLSAGPFRIQKLRESALLVGTTGGIFIRNEHEFTESVRRNPGMESPPIVCRNNRGPARWPT